MSRKIDAIEWKESIRELEKLYRTEKQVERRKRIQGIWLVRQGKEAQKVARDVGIGRKTDPEPMAEVVSRRGISRSIETITWGGSETG
jgi:hypothetical protein